MRVSLHLLVFGAVSATGCWSAGTAPLWAAPAASPPPPPPPASFDNARLSLTLQDVSLPELLHQVSAATSLQFRYATPPDVLVSASFQNAPLFPSLESALRPDGFSLLRDGQDAWVLRAYPRPSPSLNLSRPLKAPLKPKGKPGASAAKPGLKPIAKPGTRQSPPPSPPAGLKAPTEGWMMTAITGKSAARRMPLEADAREFPGVTVLLPQNSSSDSASSDLSLRYTLPLRHVPERLRLVLDTPRAALLRVNGAILRRAWKGRVIFELGKALRSGLNSIEVQWQVSRQPVSWEGAYETEPLLRYEWLSENDPPPAGASEAPLPGGFRLLRTGWTPRIRAD